MRKLIAGLTMAGAAMIPSTAEAQITRDMCVPVYDETARGGDQSAALQNIIGEYATHGIGVHVQILEESSREGIRDGSVLEIARQGKQYSIRLAELCGWQNDEIVNVVVSLDPRMYDVYETADAVEPPSQKEKDEFEGNLQRRSTPFQADVAELLEDMNPHKGNVPDQPVQQIPSQPEAPSEPINWPVKPIGYTLSGLLAVAYGAVRISRGSKVRSEKKQGIDAGTQADLALEQLLWEAKLDEAAPLKILHETDAVRLRKLVEQAETTKAGLEGSVAELTTSSRNRAFAHRIIWPDLGGVRQANLDTERLSEEAAQVGAELQRELAAVNELLGGYDGKATEFEGLVEGIASKIEGLKSQGWDLTNYENTLADLTGKNAAAVQARETGYLEGPAKLLEEGTQVGGELVTSIQTLPERRATADAEISGQPAVITYKGDMITEAKTTLAGLKDNYDNSCYEDVVGLDQRLDSILQELRGIQKNAQKYAGIKSVDAVDRAEQLIASFTTTAGNIDTLAAEIAARRDELEEIKAKHPGQIIDIKDDLELAHRYAFKEHRDDVEDDAREALEAIISTLRDFETNEVNVKAPKRPRYLTIRDTLIWLTENVEQATKLAQSQKIEMDQLRTDRNELILEAKRADDSHDTYVDANATDVDYESEQVAQRLEPPAIDTSAGSREDLKRQVAALQDFIRQVKIAHGEAEQDVQREEAKREAERERIRQVALAAERARQEAQREEARRQQAQRDSSNTGGTFGTNTSNTAGKW